METGGLHWLIEAKMEKELESEDVKGRAEAAQRWANHVSGDPAVGAEWRYLLVGESDIATSRGSWSALKNLGA